MAMKTNVDGNDYYYTEPSAKEFLDSLEDMPEYSDPDERLYADGDEYEWIDLDEWS